MHEFLRIFLNFSSNYGYFPREHAPDGRSENCKTRWSWFGQGRNINRDDDCGDGDIQMDGTRGSLWGLWSYWSTLFLFLLVFAYTKNWKNLYMQLYSTVTLRHGEKKHYNHKVDVYSFAIVLWELLHNKLPFEGMSNLQAAYAAAFKVMNLYCSSLT